MVAAGDLPGAGSTIAASSTRTDRPSFNRASGSPCKKLKPGARIFNTSPTMSTVNVCADKRSAGHASKASKTTAARRPGRYHRIPIPGIRRPTVKTAVRLSVFSGKPTTRNAGPAWRPKPVETRTWRSVPASQTEPISRKSARPV